MKTLIYECVKCGEHLKPIKEVTGSEAAKHNPSCSSDNVNNPAHYTTGNLEVIDFIEDKKLNFHRGNAVKYIVRAGIKDKTKEVEDLQKAIWYLNREIKRIEAEGSHG